MSPRTLSRYKCVCLPLLCAVSLKHGQLTYRGIVSTWRMQCKPRPRRWCARSGSTSSCELGFSGFLEWRKYIWFYIWFLVEELDLGLFLLASYSRGLLTRALLTETTNHRSRSDGIRFPRWGCRVLLVRNMSSKCHIIFWKFKGHKLKLAEVTHVYVSKSLQEIASSNVWVTRTISCFCAERRQIWNERNEVTEKGTSL